MARGRAARGRQGATANCARPAQQRRRKRDSCAPFAPTLQPEHVRPQAYAVDATAEPHRRSTLTSTSPGNCSHDDGAAPPTEVAISTPARARGRARREGALHATTAAPRSCVRPTGACLLTATRPLRLGARCVPALVSRRAQASRSRLVGDDDQQRHLIVLPVTSRASLPVPPDLLTTRCAHTHRCAGPDCAGEREYLRAAPLGRTHRVEGPRTWDRTGHSSLLCVLPRRARFPLAAGAAPWAAASPPRRAAAVAAGDC